MGHVIGHFSSLIICSKVPWISNFSGVDWWVKLLPKHDTLEMLIFCLNWSSLIRKIGIVTHCDS